MIPEVPPCVLTEVRDGVAVLSLAAPAVHALTAQVRAALLAELDRAAADPAVGAIVVTGAGRILSSDTGLDTATGAEDAPALADLCARIEAAPKPVVVGLSGTVAGPALEIALSAHLRAAHPGSRLQFPGVAWGLPPVAGATQRLPRLCGAALALDMLLDGRAVTADEALAAGLVDHITSGPRGSALVAFAAEAAGRPLPAPVRDRSGGIADPGAFLAEVQRRRAALTAADGPAAPALVRLVEGALMLPFEVGCAMERAAHADALAADATAALMHVARLEQRPVAPGATPRQVLQVAVLGADEGATLAAQAVSQEINVDLIDPDAALLDARRGVIETALARGGADTSRLRTSTDLTACGAADLVMVPGQGEVAVEYLRLAGLEAKPGAVIAAFGAEADPLPLTGRPEATVWVHWPMLDGMRRHAALTGSDPSALAAVAGLARRFGRHPMRAAAPPERAGLALLATLVRTVERLLLAGAPPGAIDAALAASGWRNGPCRGFDALGLDVVSAMAHRAAGAGWAPAPLGVTETLAAAGLTGRDAGQGLFRHEDGRADETSGALARAIDGARDSAPEGDEIVDRVLAALAACGIGLIRDGAVASAAEVDLAALHVAGVPRAWGGPMGAADRRGVLWLRGALRGFSEDDPDLWHKPAEIDRLIRDGKALADLG